MLYDDLINIDDFWKKREDFSQDRWWVAFYCKDCKKIVDTNRKNPRWYDFECKICKSTNIVIWTTEWLKSNYKL